MLEKAELELEEFASNHLCRVLRMNEGRPLVLFDGRGGEYRGEISKASPKRAVVRLLAQEPGIADSHLAIELALAISRSDRFDWALQKATELGVNSVQPLVTRRSEKWSASRAEKKVGHWQRLLISAAEQCGRCSVPVIKEPVGLSDWSVGEADIKLTLEPGREPLGSGFISAKPGSVILAVGPEGGFEEEELVWLTQRDFQAASLGPRILRTETAPIAAISLLQHLWGDLSVADRG